MLLSVYSIVIIVSSVYVKRSEKTPFPVLSTQTNYLNREFLHNQVRLHAAFFLYNYGNRYWEPAPSKVALLYLFHTYQVYNNACMQHHSFGYTMNYVTLADNALNCQGNLLLLLPIMMFIIVALSFVTVNVVIVGTTGIATILTIN